MLASVWGGWAECYILGVTVRKRREARQARRAFRRKGPAPEPSAGWPQERFPVLRPMSTGGVDVDSHLPCLGPNPQGQALGDQKSQPLRLISHPANQRRYLSSADRGATPLIGVPETLRLSFGRVSCSR